LQTAWLGATSVAGGWLLVGLTKLVLVNLFGAPAQDSRTRLLHHAIELGRHAGVGAAFGLLVYLWLRFGSESRWRRVAAVSALALTLGMLLLRADLAGVAVRASSLDGASAPRLLTGLVAVVALAVALLVELVLYTRRGYWLLVPLALAALLQYLDSTVSPMANAGAHFFLSWMSAACAASFVPPLASRWSRSRRATGRALLLAGAVAWSWSAWAVLVPQPHSVQVDISRWPANLRALRLSPSSGRALTAGGESRVGNPFFADRRNLPPVPASAHAWPTDVIVLVISIDSLRADVLEHPDQAAHMPTLSGLAAGGVTFEWARAPGTQTVVTLAGLSTGRYFSQQYWTSKEDDYEYWLSRDDSPHFATDLTRAGVPTVAVPTAHWMQQDWGLLRGFGFNEFDPRLSRWGEGEETTGRLLDALSAHPSGPLLLFAHYLDSHAPFTRGGKGASPQELYLKALRFVDDQLARLLAAIEARGDLGRTLFVVTGDHGEAFGEHNMYFHGNTLYDELLRVPLVFGGLTLTPARIDVPVSLVDLPSTLLGVYGLPSPASFMGQSLVPFLLGETRTFERPIVAEGLLRQAMIFGDGYKVIRDQRDQTIEIYDLTRDPGEIYNLSDDVDLSSEEHLQALDQFFRIHTCREPGYVPPLRK
jgi:arylsulfatase A-like enzyme